MTNPDFMTAYEHAEVMIADGVGILVAGKFLGVPCGERITGVDLMRLLIEKYPEKRIVFVGAHGNAAQKTLENLAKQTDATAFPWIAFPDVDKNDPTLIDKVVSAKPDIVFLAFGSPYQELWIETYRKQLTGSVCMGVGQAFNVYGGIIRRAPRFIQNLGLEWLYRLIAQPWRWKRQLRLLKFIYLAIRYRFLAR